MITQHETERLKRLERRLNWLRTRVYQTPDDKDLTFDKAEASALEWGIDIIEKHLKTKESECRHTWALWAGDEVFCQRCLVVSKLSNAASTGDDDKKTSNENANTGETGRKTGKP